MSVLHMHNGICARCALAPCWFLAEALVQQGPDIEGVGLAAKMLRAVLNFLRAAVGTAIYTVRNMLAAQHVNRPDSRHVHFMLSHYITVRVRL